MLLIISCMISIAAIHVLSNTSDTLMTRTTFLNILIHKGLFCCKHLSPFSSQTFNAMPGEQLHVILIIVPQPRND